MKEIKLIALDMDGTLLNDDGEIPARNREAIAEALKKDVHVVLSTGRGFKRSFPIAEDLHLSSYHISANGAEIWTMQRELLRRITLPTELVEKLYNLAIQVGAGIWMITTDGVLTTAPEDFYEYEWLKFGCHSEDRRKLDILVQEFSKFGGLEISNSLPTNIEVNAEGVSKANALNFLCDRIGITMDNVMACGDSLNDIKMIQEAGVGVAMGNAQEAIKKVAGYLTATNNDAGVAEAIERFVL